jgi:hypothetical protein
MPPTLLGLSPHFKTDAPSTHFIILVCGRAKSAARPIIHPNLYQEHMPSVVYACHPATVLVSDAGMVLKVIAGDGVLKNRRSLPGRLESSQPPDKRDRTLDFLVVRALS